MTFTATEAFPLATVVAMVAPSPDWFVGVSGVSLRTGNSWVEELVISLEPYDAGTDSGETYTSPDADLTPREPISVITGPPLSSIRSVAPLGTFTFSRVSVQVEPDSFMDDSVVSGAMVVKGVHFQEIRDRIAALRVLRGLSSVSWTDPVLTPGATEVVALHVIEMRAALNEVYVADDVPLPVYSNPTVSSGDTIWAIDINALRSAIIARE